MADRNLVLQLLITAKDEATSVFGKVFSYLDNNTRVVATKIREAFTGLFSGGLDGAMEFEAQLDRVQAKGDQTYQSFAGLGAQIRQVGAQFGISGTEAAQGMESLAAAGLSATDALTALPSVLSLASAEQISADAAAQKLIDSLSIMGMGFEETGRMADVLAKAANITTSSASQLAEALTQAGGMARAAGMDFETTAAALDLLHKNGIKGSEAGTALKSILTALIDPTSKASQALSDLGIDSRDLGSVLDALNQKGTSANGAILAFGTEAGPGLRALLSEGRAGLLEYTAQLSDSEGAASAAAAQMGGNLKSAMASLVSTWETVKQSLLEPALKPLADAAKEAASALQDTLGTKAFQSVQAAIDAFVTNALESAKRFIQGFDFSAVVPAIESFAQKAKTLFTDIASAGETAANGIKLVWSGVTIAVKSVAITLAGFTATLATSVETIVVGINQVGLVSDDMARQVRESAQKSRDGVASLRDGIREDVGDIKAAWDGLNGKINETPKTLDQIPAKVDEVQRAFDALRPPDLGNAQELQPLIKNLDFYQTKLKMTEDAQREAAVVAREAERVYADISRQFAAGAVSQGSYELAAQRVTAAQAAERAAALEVAYARAKVTVETNKAISGINEESTAATNSIKTREQLIADLQRAADKAKVYGDRLSEVGEAQIAAKRIEIDLARAKGDTAGAQKLAVELAQLEHEWSVRIAKAKAVEANANLAVAEAAQQQVARKVASNEATEKDLTLAVLNTKAAKAKADSANLVSDALQNQSATTQQTTGAIQELAVATEGVAQATEKTAKVVDNVSTMYQGMINQLGNAKEKTKELSEATGLYFDAVLNGIAAGLGIDGAMSAATASMVAFQNASRDSSDELAKFEGAQLESSQALGKLQLDFLFSVNQFDAYTTAIEIAKHTAVNAWNEQAETAERLRLRIHEMTESGRMDTGLLSYAARNAADGFHLLDNEDLSKLRDEINAATEKLEEMQQETEDARSRLSELNAELLEAKGMDEKAQLLRQELDYQTRLAEIEKQRREAELMGNRELVAILDKQAAVLRQINDAKTENIRNDADANTAGDKTARSWDAAAASIRDADAAMQRFKASAAGVAQTDLSGLHSQMNSLGTAAERLRDVL